MVCVIGPVDAILSDDHASPITSAEPPAGTQVTRTVNVSYTVSPIAGGNYPFDPLTARQTWLQVAGEEMAEVCTDPFPGWDNNTDLPIDGGWYGPSIGEIHKEK